MVLFFKHLRKFIIKINTTTSFNNVCNPKKHSCKLTQYSFWSKHLLQFIISTIQGVTL